jgi:transcriptional regulator with XRE-family HTH domain
MNRDNPNNNTPAFPVLSIFRGLYQRVAVKLGVDPSYVSRVARGERSSAAVLAALQEEMDVIREHLNHANGYLIDGKAAKSELRDGELKDGKTSQGTPQHDGQTPTGKSAKGKSAKSKLAKDTAGSDDRRVAD